MDDIQPFQEAPPEVAQRRMKQGHRLDDPCLMDGFDNLWIIRCSCGWMCGPYLREDKEKYWHIAWRHRTEPTLLLPGSSDILPAMRQATVKDLLARERD